MDEKVYWYWLCHRDGVGAVKIARLLKGLGDPKAIFYAGIPELVRYGGITEKEAVRIKKGQDEINQCEKAYLQMQKRGIRMSVATEDDFPKRLMTIPNPPVCLFIKGEIPREDEVTVAMVGARACTEYGMVQAETLAGDLAREGCWIISGLAHGIDAAAHRGTVRAGGKTLAFLGCGIDICYPKENYYLYEEILAKGGGILSEYPPGIKPAAGHFPMRNRLISGMGDALLVIEAREKSGSLITVERALEQGKDVFALPGRVTDPLSKGCLELIRDGAHILTDASDVLATLHVLPEKSLNNSEDVKNILAEDEKVVYSAIANAPKHLDEILREVTLSGVEVYAALLSLELQGLIRQTSRNYYMKAST